jgi:hypothetical protein
MEREREEGLEEAMKGEDGGCSSRGLRVVCARLLAKILQKP